MTQRTPRSTPGPRPARPAAARTVARCIALGYLVVLVWATLGPFDFVETREAVSLNVSKIKWIPFRNPVTGGLHSPRDTARNIVLFVPFGFFVFVAARGSRQPSRTAVAVVVGGFTLSTLLESLQLLTVARVTNVTDVITNTAGTYVGTLAASWCARTTAGRRDQPT